MTVKDDEQVVYQDKDGTEYVLEDQEVLSEEEEEARYEEEFNAQFSEDESDDKPKPTEDGLELEEDAELEEDGQEQQESSQGLEPDDTSDDPAEPDDSDPFSWIDSLPDEVKAKAERLRHSASADSGRVAAYNRQLRDLREEMARMKQSRPSQQDPAAQDASTSKSAVHELPKEFQQLKEDFPEFASAVDALRAHDRAEFEKQLDSKLQPLERDRAIEKQDHFNAVVDDAAVEIFNTKETGTEWRDVVAGEDFNAWLQMQPPSVQKAARTPDAEEAVYVLRQYELDYQAAVSDLGLGEPTDVPEEENNQPNKADRIKARRAKRKVESVAPGSKPIIADPNAEGGDYDAQFDAMWG